MSTGLAICLALCCVSLGVSGGMALYVSDMIGQMRKDLDLLDLAVFKRELDDIYQGRCHGTKPRHEEKVN